MIAFGIAFWIAFGIAFGIAFWIAFGIAFGIVFTLHPEWVELYTTIGNDLPERNGNGQWVLPLIMYVVVADVQLTYVPEFCLPCHTIPLSPLPMLRLRQ